MTKMKSGIAVDEDIASEVDKLVEECDDLGVSRSEIIEAILTAYVRSNSDHADTVGCDYGTIFGASGAPECFTDVQPAV